MQRSKTIISTVGKKKRILKKNAANSLALNDSPVSNEIYLENHQHRLKSNAYSETYIASILSIIKIKCNPNSIQNFATISFVTL